MGSIYQPCFNTHCCWCSPCGATRQPGCAKYISAGCESYKQGCHTSDGKQWFSWPPNKSLTLGLLVTRDTVNNSLTTWLRGTMSTLWKVKSRMFRSLVYCLWLTGARVMKGANNMPALCENQGPARKRRNLVIGASFGKLPVPEAPWHRRGSLDKFKPH